MAMGANFLLALYLLRVVHALEEHVRRLQGAVVLVVLLVVGPR